METPTGKITTSGGIKDATSDVKITSAHFANEEYVVLQKSQGHFVSPQTYQSDPNTRYLVNRPYLVDWLGHIGEFFHLQETTVHVSVLFLDKILRSKPDFPGGNSYLMAAVCLSVAAKYEEAERNCPRLSELLKVPNLHNCGFTPASFRKSELQILNMLQWKLRAISPLHVLQFWLTDSSGFLHPKDRPISKRQRVGKSLRKFASFFSNICLQESTFQQYYPTHLAAAILMACRFAVKVKPCWRPELTKLTGYEKKDVQFLFGHVWHLYATKFPQEVSKYRPLSPRSVVTASAASVTDSPKSTTNLSIDSRSP